MANIVKKAEKKKVRPTKLYADKICNYIQSTMPQVYITRVKGVDNNKFLHAAFQLRRAQYKLKYGSVSTETLYHATARGNVKSILKDNLDWRRVTRSRFGLGVSFSPAPDYANKFCNEQNGDKRAFIICRVLIGKEKKVDCSYSSYPHKCIDTNRSRSNKVVVKFEDDTFYPRYVIYYQTSCPRPSRSVRTYVGFDSDSDSEDHTRQFSRDEKRLRQRLSRLTITLN